jgi:nucleoside-diphosphate-sugar epimerase
MGCGDAGLRSLELMTDRILITGGSGFIGTNLVQHYLELGVPVLNLDSDPPRDPQHASVWRKVDLVDRGDVVAEVAAFGATHVLHMGARTDLAGRSVSDYAANTVGTENMIAALRDLSTLERVIFASTRLVCRIGYEPVSDEDYCPTTAYGESKVASERIVRTANLPSSWAIVRPTSIWGPWFAVPYKLFFLAIGRGRYVHVRNRNPAKSFGFVGNTVHELDRLLHAPDAEVHGKTLYLADYPPVRVRDMAERIRDAMGASPIRTVPLPLLKVAALGGDIAHRVGWRDPPLTGFRLNNLLTEMVYDLRPLERIVGELPFSLDQGIKRTVEWMKGDGQPERNATPVPA